MSYEEAVIAKYGAVGSHDKESIPSVYTYDKTFWATGLTKAQLKNLPEVTPMISFEPMVKSKAIREEKWRIKYSEDKE